MLYLAMTAAELRCCSSKPEHIAWMAFHFSPYGTGLSNLPRDLPPDSLLILNDRTPIRGHDPAQVCEQLAAVICEQNPRGVLLDFQQESKEAAPIIDKLLTLPCPVIVSELYANGFNCPVFLNPVPLLTPVAEYLAPWDGRQIWLDAALDCMRVTVSEQGSVFSPRLPYEQQECPLVDEALHCHYRIDISDRQAVFTLQRNADDLHQLLSEAESLGVQAAVGLYQELGR